ncbi:Cdc15p [Rhizophagus irregularis DAOM 197198w]|uniref:Cdc15p n=1 Tax=Rhizophagus irregularis (strain DAOM 197198w) TaxID=1432141 RepID=A0A015JQV8_RHIIW|nr:Cdc15p [Rhizophagus irregularis DAOM 197198w]
MDLECKEHEISRTKVPQSIQDCCGNCVRILCFKQINGDISNNRLDEKNLTLYNKVIKSERNCKLCGKLLYQGTGKWNSISFKLCSVCYRISSELIESTLVKKQISILYLPWWHNCFRCNICHSELTFTSDCQKYCASCYMFYVGCRYCLTTNIIFGPIVQSQCKKCKRISVIINSSVKSDIDDFLFYNVILDNLDKLKIKVKSANIPKYFIQDSILGYIFRENYGEIKWISYSQFTDFKEIAKGGYGIIYKATWLSNNETIILKRFNNSKNIGKYFLNKLKSLQHCMINNYKLIRTYGFTKDPKLEDYILVMKYASEGDLHKYLQKNFTYIKWNEVLSFLVKISKGLENIHNADFIHRDFHSGNILFLVDSISMARWQSKKCSIDVKIGDLGLSQAVNSKTSNNEIYGVIPYIAPEIFKGSEFSKEADIYSLGMIMWEFTTGCKPFDNVKHDHNLIYKILDGE